ncbi:SDR family oxidoreductase [candidate division WOR-3 bacterium]|nr:SDR family oxidoreductase [candidate division WOR-3 bacterium]
MQSELLESLFSLKGKIAIVTGAARGNGKAIAFGFSECGAIVYLVDILQDNLLDTIKEINNENARPVIADITNIANLRAIVGQVITQEKKIDILVNNAGISISEPSESYSEDAWDKTYEVNLKAAFRLSQLVSQHMIECREGAIINITSLGAELGFANNPAYAASKGGLKQLTKALAKDLAKYNIRVNNLCPGYIKTDMTIKSYNDPELYKERLERIMFNRWGEPEDLVGPAIFLASDASKYITGQDLFVDGGWLAKGV